MRSCKRHQHRLFKDSVQWVKGRYYFSAPDTPMVSGFHNLGSASWYDRNYGLVQGMGARVDVPEAWVDGAPPTILPLNDQVGSAECIRDGDAIADGIPAAELVNGFPPQCWFGDEDFERWHKVSTFWTCSVQRFYARVIEWMYAGEVGQIAEAFKLLLEDGYTFKFRAPTATLPSVVTVTGSNFMAVVMDGTRNFTTLALQGLYSIQVPQDFGILETNPFHYAGANYVYNAMIVDGLIPGMRAMLVGHSYGAAVAVILAARLDAAAALDEVCYLTYGCPKPGGIKMAELTFKIPGVNLANDDDIITVLPPDRLTLMPVVLAIGHPELFVWDKWLRPGNEIVLHRDGTIEPNVWPSLDFATLSNIALLVLDGFPPPVAPQHAIEEYYRRIDLRCPGAVWPVDKKLSDWLDTTGGEVIYEDPAQHLALLLIYEGISPPTNLIYETIPVDLAPNFDCSLFEPVDLGVSYKVPLSAGEIVFFQIPAAVPGKTYTMEMYADAGSVTFGLCNFSSFTMCDLTDVPSKTFPADTTDTNTVDPIETGMGVVLLGGLGVSVVWFRVGNA